MLERAVAWISRTLGRSRPILGKDLVDLDEGLLDLDEAGLAGSGARVSRRRALTVPAFYRGCKLIADDVAKLPLRVRHAVQHPYGFGWQPATDHPAYRLLKRRPNPWMTSYVFRQILQAYALTNGNGYAYIYRQNAAPIDLLPLPPATVRPHLRDGEIWYTIQMPAGDTATVPSADMLHIRGLTDDGLVGLSIISLARQTLGIQIAAQASAGAFFKRGAKPGVILETDKKLTDAQRRAVRDSWERIHAGYENAERTAVLDDGLKLKPYSVSPKDAQFLETRTFENKEIANWLGLPPHKLGDSSRTAYNSLEQENQSYLNDCLDPWLCQWEQELEAKLLTPSEQRAESHTIRFARQALVRANMEARGAFYERMLRQRVLSINEVRELEDMNPVAWGETPTADPNEGQP